MYSFDKVINNDSFWLYFLAGEFPNALDEVSDASLSELIDENYKSDWEWINEFTQYSENIFDENDGYVDNPNTIEISLNNHSFKIEFHPGDTVYFMDGDEIGCTGSHFILGKLSFQSFTELIDGVEDVRIPLLVLPMLTMEEQYIPNIRRIIQNGLESLDLKKEHITKITDMIIDGLS